jgi:predicted TIM-barrel fold metal-dependent hydrolase
MVRLMKRFPHVSLALGPQELQQNDKLCEFLELQGREQVLFRSAPEEWPLAVQIALGLPLGPATRRAYLGENAARLFGFATESASLRA